jgi:hypothetical protein
LSNPALFSGDETRNILAMLSPEDRRHDSDNQRSSALPGNKQRNWRHKAGDQRG